MFSNDFLYGIALILFIGGIWLGSKGNLKSGFSCILFGILLALLPNFISDNDSGFYSLVEKLEQSPYLFEKLYFLRLVVLGGFILIFWVSCKTKNGKVVGTVGSMEVILGIAILVGYFVEYYFKLIALPYVFIMSIDIEYIAILCILLVKFVHYLSVKQNKMEDHQLKQDFEQQSSKTMDIRWKKRLNMFALCLTLHIMLTTIFSNFVIAAWFLSIPLGIYIVRFEPKVWDALKTLKIRLGSLLSWKKKSDLFSKPSTIPLILDNPEIPAAPAVPALPEAPMPSALLPPEYSDNNNDDSTKSVYITADEWDYSKPNNNGDIPLFLPENPPSEGSASDPNSQQQSVGNNTISASIPESNPISQEEVGNKPQDDFSNSIPYQEEPATCACLVDHKQVNYPEVQNNPMPIISTESRFTEQDLSQAISRQDYKTACEIVLSMLSVRCREFFTKYSEKFFGVSSPVLFNTPKDLLRYLLDFMILNENQSAVDLTQKLTAYHEQISKDPQICAQVYPKIESLAGNLVGILRDEM